LLHTTIIKAQSYFLIFKKVVFLLLNYDEDQHFVDAHASEIPKNLIFISAYDTYQYYKRSFMKSKNPNSTVGAKSSQKANSQLFTLFPVPDDSSFHVDSSNNSIQIFDYSLFHNISMVIMKHFGVIENELQLFIFFVFPAKNALANVYIEIENHDMLNSDFYFGKSNIAYLNTSKQSLTFSCYRSSVEWVQYCQQNFMFYLQNNVTIRFDLYDTVKFKPSPGNQISSALIINKQALVWPNDSPPTEISACTEVLSTGAFFQTVLSAIQSLIRITLQTQILIVYALTLTY
jgi:hypothetical protein